MKEVISVFFDNVRDLKMQNNISNSRKSQLLEEELEFELENNHLLNILRMDYKSLNHFENTLTDLINQVMGAGIKEEDLLYEKENLKATFESLNLSSEEKPWDL